MAIFKQPIFRGSGDKKRDMPEGLWQKCPDCGDVIHELELKKSLRTCPNCNHHFTLNAQERIDCLADPGSFEELDRTLTSIDAWDSRHTAKKSINTVKPPALTKQWLPGASVLLDMLQFSA